MASIPSLLYIILGLGISIASFVINRTAQSNSLVLFLYIGIVFILIGIIKLVWGKKQEQPSSTAATPMTSGAQHPTPAHHAPVEHALPQRPLVMTPAARQYPPPNKIEKLILEQERSQAQAPAHAQVSHPHHAGQGGHATQGSPAAHPPIVHCASCGRRQYATGPACFSCGKPL